jgi:MFS family permease
LTTAAVSAPARETTGGESQRFRRLLLGSSVSMLGSRMSTIAYPMLVLFLTRSPLAAGLVGFAATAPGILFYVPAGAIVDRWDPRRVMLFSETGRGLAIATVVTAIAFTRPSVILLAAIAMIEESLGVFSTLAERSYACSLLDPQRMPAALVQNEARTHLVVLIGRPLGGFLFGLAHIFPFACDALSFLFSIGVVVKVNRQDLFLRRRSCTGSAGPGLKLRRSQTACSPYWVSLRIRRSARQLRTDIRAGLKLLLRDRFARKAVPLAATTTLIAQALIIMFLAEARAEHLPAFAIGLVLAASGVGGVTGSTGGRWLQDRPTFAWLRLQMWIWTFALLGLVLVQGGRSVSMLCVAMFVFGCTGAMSNIALNAYLTSRGADGMLARLLGVFTLIVISASAIGSGLGGVLAEWVGWRDGILVLLALVALLALVSTALSPESMEYRGFNCLVLVAVLSARLAISEFSRWPSRTLQPASAALDPRQRPHQLAVEGSQLGPGEARQCGPQRDRAVQGDPDRGRVREHVGAG